MSTRATFSRFDRYKLDTKFGDEYCEHTIIPKANWGPATGPQSQTQRWTRDKDLGSGAFGLVWLEKRDGGALRAVKQVPKSDIWNKRELLALTELGEVSHHTSPFSSLNRDKYYSIMLTNYIYSTPSTLWNFSAGLRANKTSISP